MLLPVTGKYLIPAKHFIRQPKLAQGSTSVVIPCLQGIFVFAHRLEQKFSPLLAMNSGFLDILDFSPESRICENSQTAQISNFAQNLHLVKYRTFAENSDLC